MIEMRQKTDFFPHFDEEHFWIQEKYAAIEIDYLAVAEEKQGKRIGSTIIAKIEEYARNDKLSSTLFLAVEALNSREQNSIEFYNKSGYCPLRNNIPTRIQHKNTAENHIRCSRPMFFNLAKAHACYFIKSLNGMRWKVICATLLS